MIGHIFFTWRLHFSFTNVVTGRFINLLSDVFWAWKLAVFRKKLISIRSGDRSRPYDLFLRKKNLLNRNLIALISSLRDTLYIYSGVPTPRCRLITCIHTAYLQHACELYQRLCVAIVNDTPCVCVCMCVCPQSSSQQNCVPVFIGPGHGHQE